MAGLLTMTLDEYLIASMGEPFRWGSRDCCAFVSGWIKAATEMDPFAAFAGSYGSDDEADRIVLAHGSLLAICTAEMGRLGFVRTLSPVSGDVGLIDMPIVGPTASIRSGERWVFRHAKGLSGVEARALAAWSIPRDA